MTGINVLVILGARGKSVNQVRAEAVADSPADGITVRVFDSLNELPRYSDTAQCRRAPEAVGALRVAAAGADAVLVVTHYYGRIPTMVHNAIDWLTRPRNHGALRDKPLAVIGHAAACYSGVWSHCQTEDGHGGPCLRVVEPITVSTLSEAVKKLAGEIHAEREPFWAMPAWESGR